MGRQNGEEAEIPTKLLLHSWILLLTGSDWNLKPMSLIMLVFVFILLGMPLSIHSFIHSFIFALALLSSSLFIFLFLWFYILCLGFCLEPPNLRYKSSLTNYCVIFPEPLIYLLIMELSQEPGGGTPDWANILLCARTRVQNPDYHLCRCLFLPISPSFWILSWCIASK